MRHGLGWGRKGRGGNESSGKGLCASCARGQSMRGCVRRRDAPLVGALDDEGLEGDLVRHRPGQAASRFFSRPTDRAGLAQESVRIRTSPEGKRVLRCDNRGGVAVCRFHIVGNGALRAGAAVIVHSVDREWAVKRANQQASVWVESFQQKSAKVPAAFGGLKLLLRCIGHEAYVSNCDTGSSVALAVNRC